jgi:glycosyltransferase involved in cell wall biosynthesis
MSTTPQATGNPKAWPVMVLAYNEEKHIEACLDSLFDGDPGLPLEVYVMANGCTDRTEQIVLDYGKRRPEVHLVSIKLGDKCNAWNVFIHETVPQRCPGREIYFFVDGDARSVPGSLRAMVELMRADPHAHAVSAPPRSGRNARQDAEALIRNRELVANLYALRGSFTERLAREGVRLPLKLEGDDGLLGALIKWDLDPRKNGFDDRRIAPCPQAGFEFESVSPLSSVAIRGYWKRAVRYGRRVYEFELLGKELKAKGMPGLPANITALYANAHKLNLRWNGVYTLSNWAALKEMRRVGRS